MKKRVLAVILGAVMTMSLAACGSSDAGKTSSNDSEKSYTIGISQIREQQNRSVMDLFQTKWILCVQSQHQVRRLLIIQQ